MIRMTDVFNFIDEFIPPKCKEPNTNAEEVRRRPFIMGSDLVRSNHLFEVRIKESPAKFHAFCLCLSGSDPTGKPHQIMIDITKTVSTSFFRTIDHIRNLSGNAYFLCPSF